MNGEDKVVLRLTFKKKYKKPLKDFNLDPNASLLFQVPHLKCPRALQVSLYFWKFYLLLASDCCLYKKPLENPQRLCPSGGGRQGICSVVLMGDRTIDGSGSREAGGQCLGLRLSWLTTSKFASRSL